MKLLKINSEDAKGSVKFLAARRAKASLLYSAAAIATVFLLAAALVPANVGAQRLPPPGGSSGTTPPAKKTPPANTPPPGNCGSEGGTTGCTADPAATAGSCSADAKCAAIYRYLDDFINLLSAAVGIAAVGMMIYGGIEFSSSGGDPQGVANAKKHITNALIALVAFIFLWAFLNFIIPGGILNASSPS